MNFRVFHLRLAVIAHDLFMVWLAWFMGFFIRYSIWPNSPELHLWSSEMWLVLLIQGLVCFGFNMYRGLWRFASVPDLMNLMKSAAVGTLIIAISFFLLNRLQGIPRSVLLMYPVLLIMFWGVPRIGYRMWKDKYFKLGQQNIPRVMIIGAGHIADLFMRNAVSNRSCQVVVIMDEDQSLKGSQLRGVKIKNELDRIQQWVIDSAIDLVLIAKANPSAELVKHVVDQCSGLNCKIRVAPDMGRPR